MKISNFGIMTKISTSVLILMPLCGGTFSQPAYAQGMPATAQSNASVQLLIDLITGAAGNPLSVGEEVCIEILNLEMTPINRNSDEESVNKNKGACASLHSKNELFVPFAQEGFHTLKHRW